MRWTAREVSSDPSPQRSRAPTLPCAGGSPAHQSSYTFAMSRCILGPDDLVHMKAPDWQGRSAKTGLTRSVDIPGYRLLFAAAEPPKMQLCAWRLLRAGHFTFLRCGGTPVKSCVRCGRRAVGDMVEEMDMTRRKSIARLRNRGDAADVSIDGHPIHRASRSFSRVSLPLHLASCTTSEEQTT